MQQKVVQRTGGMYLVQVYDVCRQGSLWLPQDDEKIVLGDVPKGCLVVVGEDHKRSEAPVLHVIDQATKVYDFTADSRLWMPCDENIVIIFRTLCSWLIYIHPTF
ncbi:UNVERIFIED_CONTAM: hypothetical protein Sradi_4296100 [Sesamum radiatum]|uniref:Uncharacterized protein n=1 Tax=Sesamum radiatum TaxID=300843 RepID=A0AAW2NP35_SESRA